MATAGRVEEWRFEQKTTELRERREVKGGRGAGVKDPGRSPAWLSHEFHEFSRNANRPGEGPTVAYEVKLGAKGYIAQEPDWPALIKKYSVANGPAEPKAPAAVKEAAHVLVAVERN